MDAKILLEKYDRITGGEIYEEPEVNQAFPSESVEIEQSIPAAESFQIEPIIGIGRQSTTQVTGFETEAELQMTVNYEPTTKYDDLVKVNWLGRKGAKFSSHVDPTGFHCQVTLKDQSVTATSTVSAAVARNIASVCCKGCSMAAAQ